MEDGLAPFSTIFKKGAKHKMVEFRRKLYKRGSSFETTVPMPLLFALDMSKKHNVVFKFDKKTKRWYLEFEKQKGKKSKKR